MLGVYSRKKSWLVVDVWTWTFGSLSKPFAKRKDRFGKRGDEEESRDVRRKSAEAGAL